MPVEIDRSRYMEMLSMSSGSTLESKGSGNVPSSASVDDQIRLTRSELHRIVRSYLEDDPKLRKLADEIADLGAKPLRWLHGIDDPSEAPAPGDLEAIVRSDGSRPSFLVRNGVVDQLSFPAGEWKSVLNDQADKLQSAISCVGRIDKSGQHVGTGYRIEQNHILTNRHVLQDLGVEGADGRWTLHAETTIDFGYEFRGRTSVGRRPLKSVAFAASRSIDPRNIDHTKLDLVVIELDGVPEESEKTHLPIDTSTDWMESSPYIFTIGYPGDPGIKAYNLSILERLFQSQFGCKRFAPGKVLGPLDPGRPWMSTHDATTLPGSSGSVVLIAGRPTLAVGLHYGGSPSRENYAHILGRVLETPDAATQKPLSEILRSRGVPLIDPLSPHGKSSPGPLNPQASVR